MTTAAVVLDNISKAYHIYARPIDRIKEAFHPFNKKYHRLFYALKYISITIKRGESVGIVGRNGSGKSTLLKIIAGIIPSTEGTRSVNGRIAAILELGAGFNPQFTGRENVFMNAILLGLDREEINEKFDEIIEFSGIKAFIDQPIKNYSSGMVVRLAFAVAVNVMADIIIIDEALAVGDEAFQRKCFAKLRKFREDGNTLIFVSHSPNSVVELCGRALLLENGNMVMDDLPKHIIREYHKRLFSLGNEMLSSVRQIENRGGSCEEGVVTEDKKVNPKFNNESKQELTDYWDPNFVCQSTVSYDSQGAFIRNVRILNERDKKVNILCPGKTYYYTYDAQFTNDAFHVVFGSMIKTVSGLEIGGMITHPLMAPISHVSSGTLASVRFPFTCCLTPGVYFFNAGINGFLDGTQAFLHRIVDAVMFRVQASDRQKATGIIDFNSKEKTTVLFTDRSIEDA